MSCVHSWNDSRLSCWFRCATHTPCCRGGSGRSGRRGAARDADVADEGFPQQQQQRETPVGADETELCELRRSTLLQDEELDKLRRAQKELNAQLGKLKHAKKDLERVREENVKLHAQLKERADSTKELEDLRQENKKLNAKLEELAHLRNELSDLRLLNDELRAQLERQPAELLVSLSPRGEGESRDEPLAEELIEVPRTRLVAVEEVAEAAGEAPREMLTSLTREFLSSNSSGDPRGCGRDGAVRAPQVDLVAG
ncbi:hypothetical protein LSM04_000729 [Trypanosoma melophagium]|uniref:uncharacterized protein n=1 Tax=Trypanosoma melophagium TaxID=715481 RepID=UPI00351A8224|nr:hypothetical protein LSM04_000729 [Trypanosoma melophagium]